MTPGELLAQKAPEAHTVLEVGTRRWGLQPTHHKALFPNATKYVMSDFMEGEDVDIVSDVHNLDEFPDCTFDAFYGASLFEHVQYPWVAAGAIRRILKPGGWCYIATHQTFPVHGYPSDYTRWTDNGLRSVFEWAGFTVEAAAMDMPCKILKPAEVAVWDENAPAYIGVSILGVK